MLADFQIEDVVESSPSFVAHKAYSNTSGRKCLLKKYTPSEVANAGWKDKFKYFVQEYTTINVPHLRALVDGGIDNKDGSPFAVFEWSNSPSVTKLLQEKREFTQKEVKGMILSVLEAVSFMHEKELVHGALTPDTILLNEADKMQPWVLERDPLQSLKAAFGVNRKGYEFFLSPEVVKGSKPTTKSDLFAIGKIAEAVSGETPLDFKFAEWVQKTSDGEFESATDALKSLKVVNEALVAPAQARPTNAPTQAAPIQAKPKISKPGKSNKPQVQTKPTVGGASTSSSAQPNKKLIAIIAGVALGLFILLVGGCLITKKAKSKPSTEKATTSRASSKLKPEASLAVTQVNDMYQYEGKIVEVSGEPKEIQYASGPNTYNFYFVESREDRPKAIQLVIDNNVAFSEASKNEERLTKMRADFLGKEIAARGELTKNRYGIYNLKVDDFDISLVE